MSPVWDTVLSVIGLCDAGVSDNSKEGGGGGNKQVMAAAMEWVKTKQQLGPEGDWRVLRPKIRPGGFAFEYHNSWYPDLDDNAAVLLASLKHYPDSSRQTALVIDATEWLLGMQNPN